MQHDLVPLCKFAFVCKPYHLVAIGVGQKCQRCSGRLEDGTTYLRCHFSPVCIFMCVLKEVESTQALSHWLQWKAWRWHHQPAFVWLFSSVYFQVFPHRSGIIASIITLVAVEVSKTCVATSATFSTSWYAQKEMWYSESGNFFCMQLRNYILHSAQKLVNFARRVQGCG